MDGNRIPDEALELARLKAEQLAYGSVRIEVIEGRPYVDVIVEERIRVNKPLPGNLVTQLRHG